MTTHKSMLSFSDARQRLLDMAQSIATQPSSQSECAPLACARGRITATDILSPVNIPAFRQSAMDGYAIRRSDLSSSSTTRLPLAGAIFAGDHTLPQWPAGHCLRVMTGAPLPDDAEAVIMQEDVTVDETAIQFVTDRIQLGMNIREKGENVQQGSTVITAGERLTLPKLTTLAALGIGEVTLLKPLKVAIFSTGNELVNVGESLEKPNTLYDTNRFTLKQLLESMQCEVLDFGIIQDDLNAIQSALQQASQEADLILTSGGVSVGDADYTKQALLQLGTVDFWKIAMKPGKPFAFGKIQKALFCGLPGNPVSALATFYLLVRPLILTLQHQPAIDPMIRVKTVSDLKKSVGRMDFQRGVLFTTPEGEESVQSTGRQESHLTTSFHDANCFIALEADRGFVAAGEWVDVIPFSPLLR